jgi:hypothetical protein
MKKKIYILFMSHKSGDHGLTIHDDIDDLKKELQSVVDLIDEETDEDGKATNAEAVEGVGRGCDGYWAELSDSTWFDVYEREVSFKEQKMGGFGVHPSMLG